MVMLARTVKAEPVWGPQWGVGRGGWIRVAWALCWGDGGGGGMGGVDDGGWRDTWCGLELGGRRKVKDGR